MNENEYFFNPLTNQLNHPNFRHKKSYEPFYEDRQDFNTNAPSYYDYLARFNGFFYQMVDQVNRLLRRNITFKDGITIDFSKKGDWIDNGNCHNFDDIIEITGEVIRSKATETRNYQNLDKLTYTVANAIMQKNDGLWSPNYDEILQAIDKEIGDIYNKISDLENTVNNQGNKITQLESALQKIINNLYNSGAITSNNLTNFNFNPNRNIATGNINLFGGSADGQSFIRTNNGQTENDLTGGL